MSDPDQLDRGLDRLYDARFSAAERSQRQALWATLYRHFFARYVPPDATVVDLGAGFCDFINVVEARRRIAIDLNPETARAAVEGVEVHSVPLHQLRRVVGAGEVDLAFASNVFEHLRSPEELLDTLGAVCEVLSPRGRLVILQPNVRLVGGAFWDFVDHRLPLSERGMAEALTISGFSIEDSRAGFLPYTTKSRLPQWGWMVRAYLALPVLHRVLGKQMLVVARPASVTR